MNRVGFVVALKAEGRTLASRLASSSGLVELDHGNLLIVADAGPEAASRGAELLADAGTTGLVSWGCAAALDPRLKPGDLILPQHLVDTCGDRLPVSPAWHQRLCARLNGRLPVSEGAIAESSEIVSTATEKAKMFSDSGAIAVDMESAAVARIARQRSLPMLAVRSIVDPASVNIPPAIRSAFDSGGKLHLQTLLSGLASRPWDLPGLVKLGWHFRAAMGTLLKVRVMAGNDLGVQS